MGIDDHVEILFTVRQIGSMRLGEDTETYVTTKDAKTTKI